MISGSGVQMQGTSYLPGYYHVIDHNVGGSRSLWQLLSNVLPEASSSDQFLAYEKEILRQTMLKHEAIFRNQVHELHRLYGRQRELMNEISRNHQQMQTSQSNLIPSQIQCNISEKALQIPCLLLFNPRDGKPPAQGGENFQTPCTFVSQKSMEAGSIIYLKENTLKEQKVSTSKSHYSGKRVLDLELPAEEYIDGVEEGLEDKTSIQVPQVQYDPYKSASESPARSNLKPNEASSSKDSSNCSKTSFLFDLNEPIQLDESETPNSANFIDSSIEIVHQNQDPSGKSKSESPLRNEEITYNVLERECIDGYSKSLPLKMDEPMKLLPCNCEAGNEGSSLTSGLQHSSAGPLLCGDETSLGSQVAKKDNQIFDYNNQSMVSSCITNSCSPLLKSNEAKTEASTSVSSHRTAFCSFREIPYAIQALPCFNNPNLLSKTSTSSTSNSGIKRKYCNNCCITGNRENEHVAEHNSVADCIKDSNHEKSSEDMNLNAMPHGCLAETVDRRTNGADSSVNSEEQFKRPRVKPDYDGTNLAAPVSPDNKERPPPRGESVENPIEMPSHFSEQKTSDPNEDFDRIAAEAIVSISLSAIQECLKNENINGPLDVSSGCLSWFAGIVSSVIGEEEIEFERLLNDAASSDHDALVTGEIPHFEATGFKLTGINVADHCPETSNQKSKTVSGIILPNHQQEKGRARKTRQRKGYLSSLPCIASVSSYDETKNFQPTEQLTMAAGTTCGTIMAQRNVSSNGRARRSRHPKIVSSNVMERSVCSLLKQHCSENELSFTVRSLLGWGRKRGRQKSRRARVNHSLGFNQLWLLGIL